jgi:hypothetical protein
MLTFFPLMLSDMLTELSRREKAANIKPDADIDAFMKASICMTKSSTIWCLLFTYYNFLFNLIRRLQWEGKRPMWSLTIFLRYMQLLATTTSKFRLKYKFIETYHVHILNMIHQS